MLKGNLHLKTNNTESDRVRRKRYGDYKIVGDKGTVCVTVGTGYIGSWLIKVLLEKGYAVHTTIRPDPGNKRDVSFLTSLSGADERLKIFRADLSDPETFGAAIEGCKGVLHVASPMDFQDNEPEAVVTKRAIDGALGILKTCLRSKTVKRVVFTSSIASVYFNNKDVDMMDETEHGLDLLTVIPPLVVGPFVCPKLTGSVRAALAPILGNKDDYSLLLNTAIVRVDDLSRAFIFLLEHPEAKGRYNCSSDTVTIQKIVEILSANDPEFPLPIADSLEEIEGTKMPGLSSKKLLDLGFKFKYGIEDMYDGGIKCCKEKGFL
ncbi:NAD(P)-binding Rossmann-fold superfamily protein, putative [Theobroma cacao]|uniref:NAD(P)-binding Rossmann-fold superfamily protein, putative n=1 Tax=Theobroma cacao TaxID=3641 RepID=A0A061DU37_THECC|nr:NAD(P)-binding Rossmann-fold superfamily protein, putative [Theobroma cacao]